MNKEQQAFLADRVKQAEQEVKKSMEALEKRRAELKQVEKEMTDVSTGSINGWTLLMKSWGYKDVKMENGLLISHMLRNPLYNDVVTSAKLSRQANYNCWKARNLAEYHLTGDEDALGWE